MVALIVSVLLSPVLSAYFLKGGSEKDTKIVAVFKSIYLRVLHGALGAQKATLAIALGLLSLTFVLYPLLGKSFIPVMREGSITPVIIRVPSISLEESIKLEAEAMRLVAAIPGVKTVVSKLGRGESPADPASPNESDPIAVLDLEGSGRTQQEIEEDIRKALAGTAWGKHRPVATDRAACGRDGNRGALAGRSQNFRGRPGRVA